MTLTVAATPQFGVSPMLRILASSTNSAPNAIPESTQIRVNRIHADGSTHRVLTDADPRLIGGTWAFLDAHAPYNQPVLYTVTANGITATSSPAWLLSKKMWLLHPSEGSLAVAVDVVSEITDRTTATRSARFELLGAAPVFLSDGKRNGVTGSLTVRITPAQESVFRALFDADTVILLNTPGTKGWDLSWVWVQPLNVVYGNKTGGLVSYPYRDVTIQFEQAGDPDSEFESDWTYADLDAAYATYTALDAAFASYADVVTNTHL